MGVACCKDQQHNDFQPNGRKSNGKVIPLPTTTNSKNINNNLHNHEMTFVKKQSDLKPQGFVYNSQEKVKHIHIKRSPQNYQSIKYLGKGIYGNVVLAQDKETSTSFAMKIIAKNNIIGQVLLSSSLLQKISNSSDLFVHVRQTFQNASNIYIVMQYLQKGDIYYYLKKKACVFRQDIIQMLVAQIICAIQILHKNGISYRCLKPQNVLVTDQGHIKLNDYSFSLPPKYQYNILNFQTLQYTSPQNLDQSNIKQNRFAGDVWAIGVLMYQLKFQHNLFQNKDMQNVQIEQKIKNLNIQQILNQIVGKIGYDFRDLLIKLLQVDNRKRITIQQIKNHAFFQGIKWQDIPLRKNSPPLKQILQIDHIKFKDPTNQNQFAHRRVIKKQTKDLISVNLYQFVNNDDIN